MLIEFGQDFSTFLAIAPVVAITVGQVKAIFDRDNHQCMFRFPHDCRGKLTVHHINGKEDEPFNLASVCHSAHWNYLHNGASPEQKNAWESQLRTTVEEKTSVALTNGWVFPDTESP